jgi:hypothetical protein
MDKATATSTQMVAARRVAPFFSIQIRDHPPCNPWHQSKRQSDRG